MLSGTSSIGESEAKRMRSASCPAILQLTFIQRFFFIKRFDHNQAVPPNLKVSWCNWLSHLINTQEAPGSIPGEANNFRFFVFHSASGHQSLGSDEPVLSQCFVRDLRLHSMEQMSSAIEALLCSQSQASVRCFRSSHQWVAF